MKGGRRRRGIEMSGDWEIRKDKYQRKGELRAGKYRDSTVLGFEISVIATSFQIW
jgi:hypothetical protein